jgi:hypothetical protein
LVAFLTLGNLGEGGNTAEPDVEWEKRPELRIVRQDSTLDNLAQWIALIRYSDCQGRNGARRLRVGANFEISDGRGEQCLCRGHFR